MSTSERKRLKLRGFLAFNGRLTFATGPRSSRSGGTRPYRGRRTAHRCRKRQNGKL